MQLATTETGVEIGAAVTLTNMMVFFRHLMATRPAHETSGCAAVVNQLRCVLPAGCGVCGSVCADTICMLWTAAVSTQKGCNMHTHTCTHARWFAGNQIRNVSAIGGNIVTGSPISDLNPIWMAAGERVWMEDAVVPGA